MDTDVPPILLPCAICTRTFMPESLEKHSKICERAAAKKRKPFDSAKQRIQGTDLAEFLPRQDRRRQHQEESNKPKSTWKQTHNEFLQVIRAARGEVVDTTTHKQQSALSSGAPTKANEKGMCPTCNRHFGIKAYDRHVAWCKERNTRLPTSPATNIAKERLEARMKYRAPVLKNRRSNNREKSSPGSSVNTNKTSPPLNMSKTKESASLPNCKRSESPVKQKSAAFSKRCAPPRESSNLSEPMKQTSNGSNSGALKDYDPFLLAEQQMNDLLSDSSDLSAMEDPSSPQTFETQIPLSRSSVLVKCSRKECKDEKSLELDDHVFFSDFSSDSTEINSLSREIFLKDSVNQTISEELIKQKLQSPRSPVRKLGRRVIIDRSKALGSGKPVDRQYEQKKTVDKVTIKAKLARPLASNHSRLIRASSAPKSTHNVPPFSSHIKNLSNSKETEKSATNKDSKRLFNSNLSLSSIVSSEVDVKRSNSMFDELMTYEDDRFNSVCFPSLRSFLKDQSLSVSSPVYGSRQRGEQISDEDFSSPDSYRRKTINEHKLNADSAYSSLNRKYFNHGRSTNDADDRFEEILPVPKPKMKVKLSKYCYECGSKFPETAKFCCECGVKRLVF